MTDYLDPRGADALRQQNAPNSPNLNDPIQRALHGGDAPQAGSHGFDAHERVQGVTVCVNYSDFLEVTLEENLSHFSEFVVVTDYRDRKTQGVCQKHSVYCVQTDVFFERPGDVFNKGAAINLGIAHLRKPGWFVHLDADIVLPDRFNTALYKARLDPECIYGADRLEVVGFEQWQKQQSHGAYKRQHQYRCLLQNPGNKLGARLIHNRVRLLPHRLFSALALIHGEAISAQRRLRGAHRRALRLPVAAPQAAALTDGARLPPAKRSGPDGRQLGRPQDQAVRASEMKPKAAGFLTAH